MAELEIETRFPLCSTLVPCLSHITEATRREQSLDCHQKMDGILRLRDLSLLWDKTVKINGVVQLQWKRIWWFHRKLNTELLYEPAVPLLDPYLKELESSCSNKYLYTYVQIIIYNSQMVGVV